MNRIKTKGYGKEAKAIIILAHGAGAPMDSPFMEMLSEALAGQGIESVRFEFPFMVKRREDGKKRPPDRQPVLLDAFEEQVSLARAELGSGVPLLVGGKSMGGRMATLLAALGCEGVDGVVCYGYPFHPPGKLGRWRTEHLEQVRLPLLVVQGTRDPFGKPDELKAVGQIPGLNRLCWLNGGNHDFQPLARQPERQSDLVTQAALLTRQFVEDSVL